MATTKIYRSAETESGEILYTIEINKKIVKKDASITDVLEFLHWTDSEVDENG